MTNSNWKYNTRRVSVTNQAFQWTHGAGRFFVFKIFGSNRVKENGQQGFAPFLPSVNLLLSLLSEGRKQYWVFPDDRPSHSKVSRPRWNHLRRPKTKLLIPIKFSIRTILYIAFCFLCNIVVLQKAIAVHSTFCLGYIGTQFPEGSGGRFSSFQTKDSSLGPAWYYSSFVLTTQLHLATDKQNFNLRIWGPSILCSRTSPS